MTSRDDFKRPAVVLLAEDNPADQEIARRVLGSGVFRCELHMVNDGVEALEYLSRTFEHPDTHPRPDLLLLDINMPRRSGIEVLKQVKEDDDLRSIPALMLTTSVADADIVSAYDLGCNSYISKPVDVPQFVEALRKLGQYWLDLVALPGEAGNFERTEEAC
jgi:chemotaxis family two-component system response regulator Rcp1